MSLHPFLFCFYLGEKISSLMGIVDQILSEISQSTENRLYENNSFEWKSSVSSMTSAKDLLKRRLIFLLRFYHRMLSSVIKT